MTAARLLALPTLAVVSLWALPAAAQDHAQDAPGDDSVNMVIVYGEDECPQSTEAEITVCARRPEGDRFRIPSSLRTSDSPENTSWTQRVQKLETVGNFGAMSCSPRGAGGFTGCTQALVDAAYAAKKESSDIRFGELIEKARQERLSTIDTDAAAEQARVEQIEKQQLDKAKADRADAVPDAKTESAADNPPRH
ncbi:hypothetical protein D6858_14635 [Tsuneonella suprasediminis]|uniref:Uncharacterized protein n=1 Tax=Tsuneonella suprasediminis TaxID=2306996 RepID=A0A419QY06_9SPHN|nr:hypothetical protein [Tsuneonella suprasediminis]RJX65544.1 hypothetical protein D6858_14635 [Tsuneonella suprasediminis]